MTGQKVVVVEVELWFWLCAVLGPKRSEVMYTMAAVFVKLASRIDGLAVEQAAAKRQKSTPKVHAECGGNHRASTLEGQGKSRREGATHVGGLVEDGEDGEGLLSQRIAMLARTCLVLSRQGRHRRPLPQGPPQHASRACQARFRDAAGALRPQRVSQSSLTDRESHSVYIGSTYWR